MAIGTDDYSLVDDDLFGSVTSNCHDGGMCKYRRIEGAWRCPHSLVNCGTDEDPEWFTWGEVAEIKRRVAEDSGERIPLADVLKLLDCACVAQLVEPPPFKRPDVCSTRTAGTNEPYRFQR